jgi:endothelin-converting enzyme
METVLGPQVNDPSIVSFLTNKQLFFVSFAQTWCTKARDEFIKQRLLTDVHSPPKARVIVPLSNLKQFSEAFSCPLGSRMNPEVKCELF